MAFASEEQSPQKHRDVINVRKHRVKLSSITFDVSISTTMRSERQ
jgi:hypothetical protein